MAVKALADNTIYSRQPRQRISHNVYLNNGPYLLAWPYLINIDGKQAQITIRRWKKVGNLLESTKFDVLSMTDSKSTLGKRKEREEGDPLTHG